jgi:hypothetical protein
MKISLQKTAQNAALKELAQSFSPELAREFLALENSTMENKSDVLRLAKKLLVECDDIDEEICISIDYLQCQVDHLNNQQKVLSTLQTRQKFDEEFGDLRYLIREIRDSLMESIRYGKRTREIDEILLRLGELISLANQSRMLQPTINFTGIENTLSPRCSNCSAPCLSAFRKVQVFLLKLNAAIQSTYGADSNSKAG